MRAACALGALFVAAPLASAQPSVALVGATLRSGEGAPVENATVVLAGGRVVAAGAGARVPAGAREIALPPGAVV
ncbi:MAG: hypothetical protein AAF447_21235, partial [Myxococcota bacterium]